VSNLEATESVFVQPDSFWIASASGERGCETVHELVRVSAKPPHHETTVTLVMQPRGPTGSVHIDLIDEHGTPIGAFAAELDRMADISELWAPEMEDAGSSRVLEAAPGRYVLKVAPGKAIKGMMGATDFLPEQRIVDVRAGTTQTVRIHARRGGRLLMTIRLPAGEKQEDSWIAGSIAVRAASGTETRIGDFIDLRGGRGGGIMSGRAFTHRDLLEPGRYTLEVRAEGFAPASLPVDVTPGQMTPVEIQLAR
jgi:hypothetical protein